MRAAGEQAAQAGHGLDPVVLAGVAAILLAAKVCGEIFERAGQPSVLGELVGGILLGNLALLGVSAAEPLKTNAVVAALAEIGVIILLFEVGLESNLGEMLEVGWSSLLVAVAGVVAPFFLGWGVSAYFMPGEARLAHVFIGATLCATSVGITARVLKDLGKLRARESRIILGAAVIDDVLGLIVLAVVAGTIRGAAAGTNLSATGVAWIALKSLLFLGGAVLAGKYVVPHVFRALGRFRGQGVLLAVMIAFCFLLAWAANLMGLAFIVGAFAAGLVLEEAHFGHLPEFSMQDLRKLVSPVSTVLTPVFFVLMGLKVDLRVFARPGLLAFAVVLTLAAIAGKQVCSLAAVGRRLNRLAIGVGMIPRGEVGLIFAGIGATLMLPAAGGQSEPVVGPATFGAVVIMVVVTTLVTPPALKWSLARKRLNRHAGAGADVLEEQAEEAAERVSR